MTSKTATSHLEKAFAVEQVAKNKSYDQTTTLVVQSEKKMMKLNVSELNNPFTIEGHLFKGLTSVK
jgi:hypothetical protein